MRSMITNMVSPEASIEPHPDIVQNYTVRLQSLGYCPILVDL